MGMYTEIVVKIDFRREQIGDNNFNILDYLFNPNTMLREDNDDAVLKIIIPEHEFFKCRRWRSVGNMCSFYHHPERVNSWAETNGNKDYIYLFARNDLKNYDDEIEKFFNWLNTLDLMYEGDFMGYSLYEEDDTPTIYHKG